MYQALYRKYRPQTFDDVVGQPHITDNAARPRCVPDGSAHAYLFTGTRGTGKTYLRAAFSPRRSTASIPVDGNPCNDVRRLPRH